MGAEQSRKAVVDVAELSAKGYLARKVVPGCSSDVPQDCKHRYTPVLELDFPKAQEVCFIGVLSYHIDEVLSEMAWFRSNKCVRAACVYVCLSGWLRTLSSPRGS